jgi:carboxyl-terminal processing protease
MFPASNRLDGGNFGFPDPCGVPAVPAPIITPFPDFGMHMQATQFSLIVKVSMGNALNIGAMISMTTGMEPGSATPIKGPGRFTLGSLIVYIERLPAVRLLCMATGNNGNNPLAYVLIPTVTTVFFSYRHGDFPAETAPVDAAIALGASLRAAEVRGRMVSEGVGHVTVSAFAGGVPSAVFNEIRALARQGMRALVLDLRGNRGGDLDAFLRLADDFLDRGAILARMLDEDGDEIVYRARQGDPYRVALVVLVDRSTASASELFAGCMQAHGRALVVGERTCGKGTVQRLVPSSDGGGSRFADAGFVALPDGRPVQGFGVSPDVQATASGPGDDRALAVAVKHAADRASRAAVAPLLSPLKEVR